MSTTPEKHEATPHSDESPEPESSGSVGMEVGSVEGEGTTFEPEEDPEAAGRGDMYFDSKPCAVCGAEVDLSPARSVEGTSEPDGTIDERTCTNPECPTNRSGTRTTEHR